ncbi:hypothetical protein AAVH_29551, partial [Aphelenchoides avenae]
MSSTIVTPTDERFRFCGVHVKVRVNCDRIVMTVTIIATEKEPDLLTWITLTVGFLLAFSAHALHSRRVVAEEATTFPT